MKIRFAIMGFLVVGFLSFIASAGPKLTFNDGKSTLELTQTYQFWAVGEPDPNDIPQPDKRLDFYIRRARFGFKGQAWTRLDYQTQFAFDNLGKDPYTGTIGSPQQLENTEFRTWDAYFMYHLDSAWANVTFGLFRPQVSREFSNPFYGVPSLEYALSFYYLRDELDTRPTARETGVNIGGLYADPARFWGVAYNAGVFDAAQEKNSVLKGSLKWSPLLTGRVAFSLGQPESKTYRLVPDVNFFGTRKGVSIGIYGTYQGQVDESYEPKDTVVISKGILTQKTKGYKGGFKQNDVYGADILGNWAAFEADGEYSIMRREFSAAFMAANPLVVLSPITWDRVWHVRGGYSFPLWSGMFIEPTIMYTRFDGDAHSLLYPSGIDHQFDGGINWYINKNNLKVSLHYVKQGGQAKSSYTSGLSNGVQKVRDDFLALAFQLGI
jgi:hypothetical protein